MSTDHRTRPSVYLTGSVNQPSAEDTFRYIGRELGHLARRIPDGEPGERANWVLTQTPHFFDNPGLELVPADAQAPRGRVRVRSGVDPADIAFGAQHYASSAAASYAAFAQAKKAGQIHPDARFLVSVPTPFNAVSFFTVFEDQLAVLPAYTARTKEAVYELQETVPPHELAVQWDLPTEVATIEGWFPNPFPDHESILEHVAELASWLDDPVELTFHLCYGDSKFGASPFMGTPEDPASDQGGRHIWPKDSSTITFVANGLSRLVPRRINAIHAATVRTWNRRSHWQPLSGLALEDDTQFYLGLVHVEDGLDGSRRRLDLAAGYLDDFGLSTECGLGRHSAEQQDEALRLFRTLSTS